jgi:cytochrome c oxidase subunit 3
MEIPYTIQIRPDTGLYNAKLGIWLFLASEVMLFGGLFSAYILLRVGAEPGMWPHGWLNGKFKFFHACTILLALTFLGIKSYEYHDKLIHYEVQLTNGKFADGHLVEKSADFDLAKKTGTVTLHGRIVEDEKELMDLRAIPAEKPAEITVAAADIKKMENYGPKHNTFTAIYFTLTGLHALHILGGTLVIFYFWAFGGAMWKTDPERFTNRIEVSGLFWHFVDLVWIFLFPVLYLT